MQKRLGVRSGLYGKIGDDVVFQGAPPDGEKLSQKKFPINTTRRDKILDTEIGKYCEHDELAASCGYDACLAKRTGFPRRVWRTRGGSSFHRKADCYLISEGHQLADRRKNEIHDAVPVPLSEAVASLGPCPACFPSGLPSDAKPCRTRINGRLIDAFLIEVVRGLQGRMMGKVNYLRYGERAELLVSMENIFEE